MSLIAFLATLPALTKSTTPPAMPEWQSLRYSKKQRLDIRPVLWSLRNKPQDWEWQRGRDTIGHIPSGHSFWVYSMDYHLHNSTQCSCTQAREGRFSFIQRRQFGRAFASWRRWQKKQFATPRIEAINKEFRQHFI